MQNFDKQQKNLIKNATIVYANWEAYGEIFKYLYVNDGFGFQSEFFNKQKEYGHNLDLLKAGCFPFLEGLFVYIPHNQTAFYKTISQEKYHIMTNDNCKLDRDGLLLTFDKKTYDAFLTIKQNLKIQEILLKLGQEEVFPKPTFFKKVKQFFGICKS